jgi:hypothetical protein
MGLTMCLDRRRASHMVPEKGQEVHLTMVTWHCPTAVPFRRGVEVKPGWYNTKLGKMVTIYALVERTAHVLRLLFLLFSWRSCEEARYLHKRSWLMPVLWISTYTR